MLPPNGRPTAPPTSPPPGQPAVNANAEPFPEVKTGSYIIREQPKKFSVRARVLLLGTLIDDVDGQPIAQEVFLQRGVSVVWPLIPETAAHTLVLDEVEGRLKFDGEDIIWGLLTGQTKGVGVAEVLRAKADGGMYQSGVWLSKWSINAVRQFRMLRFEVMIPTVGYRLRFDEAGAGQVPWPTGPWPEVAQATFGEQLFIDLGPQDLTMVERRRDNELPPSVFLPRPYEKEPLRKAIAEWTDGKPKGATPLILAKVLAGKVIERVRNEGDPREYSEDSDSNAVIGALQGYHVQSPNLTLERGAGTELDMAVLLTTLYREAGLPARLVIGADDFDGPGRRSRATTAGIVAWVEWCLYDEAKRTINWIPVYPAGLRRAGNRAPALDRTWPYFGAFREIRDWVPFALHFQPPTAVVSYGWPAFWGIFALPAEPYRARQSIEIDVATGAVRGDSDHPRPGSGSSGPPGSQPGNRVGDQPGNNPPKP